MIQNFGMSDFGLVQTQEEEREWFVFYEGTQPSPQQRIKK